MNERFQRALKRIPQTVPPIWFMRQAGRYHKHYQELRAKHTFEDLCRIPELAAKVALGPIEDFDFDVAILFSDLLFSLEALGLGLSYASGGPEITTPLDEGVLANLRDPKDGASKLVFQKEAMQLTRRALPADKSLIGFVGGPATLFAYATGAAGKVERLIEAKRALRLFEPFCEKLIPLLLENIRLQLEGGAEVVMIFDTFAGNFSWITFKELIAPCLLEIAQRFPEKLGYYARAVSDDYFSVPEFTKGPWAGIGADHRFNIRRILELRPDGFVQGNFDEGLLHLPPPQFQEVLERYLDEFAQSGPESRAGWVCGLGHGVTPNTPEENVKFFVKRTREFFS